MRVRTTGVRAAAAALAVGLLLAGCGGDDRRPAPDAASDAGDPAGDSSASADSIADRCLSRLPEGLPAEPVHVEGPGMHLFAALAEPEEPASTGAVLLPQIGASGLCGWLPYAAHLVGRGAAVLAVDPCGYGDSECDAGPAIGEQVDLAVEHLRRETGVRRVVLLGASMGGSQTVRAVAQGADVDAWVDVSGPSAWEGESLLDVADSVRHPGLVVYARDDGRQEFLRARELAARTGAAFLGPPAGHGWELLLDLRGRTTRVGERVLSFACPRPGC